MAMITRDEYRTRQAAFAGALRRAGLPGAVVFSRGGATFDRFADVFYLTGFYQSYSYLPETPGLFSGRAHCALVVTADGASILCVAVAEYDPADLLADDIRHSDDFARTVSGAMRDAALASGTVGLVGSDILPVFQDRRLRTELPDVAWRDCDELLHAIRRIKSPAEQALIRRAARVHADALYQIAPRLQAGNTEAELFAPFMADVTRAGAGIYFAAMSSGPKIAHWCSEGLIGFSTRRITAGEMLRFDTGIVLGGYLSDFGHTTVCGTPSADQRRLINMAQDAVDHTIAEIRPGRTVAQIVAAGERTLADLGVTQTEKGPGTIHSSFPVHWGHGLGMGWERPMMTASDQTEIVPGMYLAIERTLTMPGTGTAAAEQTILVTDSGVEVISAGPNSRWD